MDMGRDGVLHLTALSVKMRVGGDHMLPVDISERERGWRYLLFPT